MGDLFYRGVRALGRRVLLSSADALVLHEDRARMPGGYLLAANHHSIYDAPFLVATTGRVVDWLSIVELFQTPWQRGFMAGMNCLALDRRRADPATTRQIVRRLKHGRVVGLFPEAGLRKPGASVLRGGPFASGISGLARLAQTPILPVVVLGAGQYERVPAWLPLGRTFVAINYGEPLRLAPGEKGPAALQTLEKSLSHAFRSLFLEIQAQPIYQKNASGSWWETNFPLENAERS